MSWQRKAKEIKKKKFDDISELSKALILNASAAENALCTHATPCRTCEDFYAKKNALKAQEFLEEFLKTAGCVAKVNQGMSLALYAGLFLRDVDDLPGNFTIFLVPKQKPNACSSSLRSMMLQLKSKFGKGWSEQDFKQAIKQGVCTPNDVEDLRYALENFADFPLSSLGPSPSSPQDWLPWDLQ